MIAAGLQPLAPEDRLIIGCCAAATAEETWSEAVEPGLDWEYIRAACVRHGVAPLVSRALEQAPEPGQGSAEAAARAELDRLRSVSRARHKRLYTALRTVVERFAAKSVDVLALKDVGLAVASYPEPGLRPLGDLDLLIRRPDYERARDVLVELGFVPDPREAPYLLKYGLGHHFIRQADDVWIDLQWDVAQREWDLYGEGSFSYGPDNLWLDAIRVDAGGFELRVPSLEELLFHLCLHLEGHEYGELVLFCDVAQLLHSVAGSFDWERLVRRAREAASESSVYHALLVAERLLGARVPPRPLEALRPPYFRGPLYAPLFANLAPLHESLDEIRVAADPPAPLLGELETIVREQAAHAMRAQAELDALATRFVTAGGRFFAFAGERPDRTLPSRSVPPFETLQAYVLAEDENLFAAQLVEHGFSAAGDRATKRCRLDSTDPAVAPDAVLTIEIATKRDCAQSPVASGRSKARKALGTLAAHAARARRTRQPGLRVLVHTLPAEETAVTLARAVSERTEGRLFSLVNLSRILHFLPASGGPGLAEAASRCGAQDALGAITAAYAVADGRPTSSASPPRLLAAARVGAAGDADRAALRRLYLVLFAGLTGGWSVRAAFLRHMLERRDGRPRVVTSVVRDLAAVVRRRGGAAHSRSRESFWSEDG